MSKLDIDSIELLHKLADAGYVVTTSDTIAALMRISSSLSALQSFDKPYAAAVVGLVTTIITDKSVHDSDHLCLILEHFASLPQVPSIEPDCEESENIEPDLRPVSETGQQPYPAIRQSVSPDHIICLEDGVQRKMMKHHLKRVYGMTPDQYRSKWGLPPNYLMTAPNYSKQRSLYAHSINFGTFSKIYRRPRADTKLH